MSWACSFFFFFVEKLYHMWGKKWKSEKFGLIWVFVAEVFFHINYGKKPWMWFGGTWMVQEDTNGDILGSPESEWIPIFKEWPQKISCWGWEQRLLPDGDGGSGGTRTNQGRIMGENAKSPWSWGKIDWPFGQTSDWEQNTEFFMPYPF